MFVRHRQKACAFLSKFVARVVAWKVESACLREGGCRWYYVRGKLNYYMRRNIMFEIISGVLAIVVLVVYYKLAKMNNIGTIFRTIWNCTFILFSVIPLLGWMSRFVITTDERE